MCLNSSWVTCKANDMKIFLNNQKISTVIYNEMLHKMGIDDSCGDRYPSYYCGAYINDSGILVVKTTDECSARKMLSSINNGDDVILEEGTVPLNRLNKTVMDINLILQNNPTIISCVYTDIFKEKVIVCMNELSEESIKKIRQNLDYNELLIFCSNDCCTRETNLGGAYKITSTDNNGNSTIGFAATDNSGNKGYVIAGHAGDFIGEYFKYNGTIIGSVTQTNYINSSTTADAAFVKSNGNFTPSKWLRTGEKLSSAQTYEYAVNTLIDMCGYVSGWQSGYITSTNMTVSGTVTLTKQVYASYLSEGGDSGAPVMIYDYEDDGVISYALIGIHVGSRYVLGTRVGAYYSLYKYINQTLGVTCITG